jgi:PAS domain S-box-containing protein
VPIVGHSLRDKQERNAELPVGHQQIASVITRVAARLAHVCKVLRHSPPLLWVLVGLVLSCSASFCYFELRLHRLRIESLNGEIVDHVAKQLSDRLAKSLIDLSLIADDPAVAAFLLTPDEPHRIQAERRLLWWAEHEKSYFVLRLIDVRGREWIRINNDSGGPRLVTREALQDKSNRYFFSDAIGLNKGEAYMSALDLHVERGAIEDPPHPTVRVATPLFDRNLQRRGVLVLNYQAREMLDEADGSSLGGGTIEIMNSAGYFLKAASPSMEWGFMLPGRERMTFQSLHPVAWSQITSSDYGIAHEGGTAFIYRTVTPRALARRDDVTFTSIVQSPTSADSWIIVAALTDSSTAAYSRSLILWTSAVDTLILATIFIVGRSFVLIRWQRAEAERELKQQAKMLELAEDSIYIFGWGTFRLTFMNGGAEKLHGWRREQMLGKVWKEFCDIRQLRLPVPFETITEGIQKNNTWVGEVRSCSREGQEMFSLSRWTLLRDSTGAPVSMLIISHDITDRKRAEEEAARAQRDTELFLNSIPSLLVSLSSAGAITRWNPAAESSFGVSGAQACGKTLLSCGVDWAGADPELEILIKMGDANKEALNHIKIMKSGEIRLIGLRVTRVRDGGNTAGYLIVGADITERVALETQLRQAQKMEAIGQLAAGIAHEINTPTQYVSDNTTFLQESWSGISRLLATSTRLREEAASGHVSEASLAEFDAIREEIDLEYLLGEIPQALSQSLDGLHRVSKITRAMKEFSHPGQESKKAVDINHAVETTVTVARNEWKYIADVETHLDASLPQVPCLAGEFNQVLLNLIVNAAQAIAEARGGRAAGDDAPKGKITITTLRVDVWAEIRITDTGCGIPERCRNRIFEPFFTTKEVGKGTGQGLALAHNVIVQGHGGRIWFESEAGVGTTFFLRIPLQAADPAITNAVTAQRADEE